MGLAFERTGSGPPLVLLHGVGHRRQAWHAVLDRLTPHRDVILVDLPGHGESPPLEHDLPILVFNYRVDGNIERAVRGEDIGTRVGSRVTAKK